MAAAAILNFRKMLPPDICTKLYGEMHHGHAEIFDHTQRQNHWTGMQTHPACKLWRRRPLCFTKNYTPLSIIFLYHTVNTPEWRIDSVVKPENPRWWRPPSWISEKMSMTLDWMKTSARALKQQKLKCLMFKMFHIKHALA